MIHIDIICCGKLKERFWTEACDEYLKRLSGFANVTVTELPEIKNASGCNSEVALEREAANIFSRLKKGTRLFALSPEGKLHTTKTFSGLIFNSVGQGYSTITFLIGSSNGLSQKIKDQSDELISFSPMTFPHHLFRVMLLEQLYRCFMDNSGRVYSK